MTIALLLFHQYDTTSSFGVLLFLLVSIHCSGAPTGLAASTASVAISTTTAGAKNTARKSGRCSMILKSVRLHSIQFFPFWELVIYLHILLRALSALLCSSPDHLYPPWPQRLQPSTPDLRLTLHFFTLTTAALSDPWPSLRRRQSPFPGKRPWYTQEDDDDFGIGQDRI